MPKGSSGVLPVGYGNLVGERRKFGVEFLLLAREVGDALVLGGQIGIKLLRSHSLPAECLRSLGQTTRR